MKHLIALSILFLNFSTYAGKEELFQVFLYDSSQESPSLMNIENKGKLGVFRSTMLGLFVNKNKDIILDTIKELPAETGMYEIKDVRSQGYKLYINKSGPIVLGAITSLNYPQSVLSEFFRHTYHLSSMYDNTSEFQCSVKHLLGEYKTKELTKLEEVELVVGQAKEAVSLTIENVIKRGDKLEELDDKAKELEKAANIFNKKAKKLKNQYWCRKYFCCC